MTKEKLNFFIDDSFNIKQAMKRMAEIGQKTVFVLDNYNRLAGSLSDGDMRKWILEGGFIQESVTKIYNKSPKYVSDNYNIDSVKELMLTYHIECVPVVNTSHQVVDVCTWENVFAKEKTQNKHKLSIQVVIMAGGKGTRLDPFTKILPKPLIPIGEKAVIEIIMDKFNQFGIDTFFLTLNHKSILIKSYFEESNLDYNISFIQENKPLGTAGSLRLIKDNLKDVFIVTNCDIIINADCSEIISHHEEKKNDITLIVSCRHYTIPYGVCEIENGGTLKQIKEKPSYDLLVNTGMYVMNKNLIDVIPHDPDNEVFDMDTLIICAKKQGYKIGVYPISEESWIDIGQWDEYRKAIKKISIN